MLKNLSSNTFTLNESIVTESKRAENVKVVFLSATAEKITKSSNSMYMFAQKCVEAGFEFLTIDPSNATIFKNQDCTYTVIDNEKTYTLSLYNTIIVPRRTVLKNSESRNFMYLLQGYGFFCLNTMEAFENCEDKYVTARKLKQFGVPTPRTTIISQSSFNKLEKKVEAVGGTFPIVCKILNGTQGIGVFIVDSLMSLRSTLQTMFKLSPKSDILLQEKIDTDFDMRVHVIFDGFGTYNNDDNNFKVIGCMQRNKLEGDFRSNYSLGSTAEKGKITDEQKLIAIHACKATGCRWAGVDLITDKHTGETYVIEVNSSPGTKGITTAAGDDVVGSILSMFKNFKYTIADSSVIGKYEYGKLKSLDKEVTIKFDVNKITSIIPCSSIKTDEENETVNFVFNDTTYTLPLIGLKNGNPFVNIDISFNETLYSDELFMLVEHPEITDSLIYAGTRFLSRISQNVSISASNYWILTDNILNFKD